MAACSPASVVGWGAAGTTSCKCTINMTEYCASSIRCANPHWCSNRAWLFRSFVVIRGGVTCVSVSGCVIDTSNAIVFMRTDNIDIRHLPVSRDIRFQTVTPRRDEVCDTSDAIIVKPAVLDIRHPYNRDICFHKVTPKKTNRVARSVS